MSPVAASRLRVVTVTEFEPTVGASTPELPSRALASASAWAVAVGFPQLPPAQACAMASAAASAPLCSCVFSAASFE